MLQNEGFKLCFSEIFFVLGTPGPQKSVKHLGPLGTALPHPPLEDNTPLGKYTHPKGRRIVHTSNWIELTWI